MGTYSNTSSLPIAKKPSAKHTEINFPHPRRPQRQPSKRQGDNRKHSPGKREAVGQADVRGRVALHLRVESDRQRLRVQRRETAEKAHPAPQATHIAPQSRGGSHDEMIGRCVPATTTSVATDQGGSGNAGRTGA